MYTAMAQTTFGGPAPIWSKDEWSFVPVYIETEFSSSEISKDLHSESIVDPKNLTLETPAIRARLACSVLNWPKNTSLWLESSDYLRTTDIGNNFYLKYVIYEGNVTTRLTAQVNYPECCDNRTEVVGVDKSYKPMVHAYWTENWTSAVNSSLSSGGTNKNFTVKWIRGPASFNSITGKSAFQVYFPEPPSIQALNCMPTIESTRAIITAEPSSGVVQDYHILEEPVSEDVAWSDAYQWRDIPRGVLTETVGNTSESYYIYNRDVTTR